MYSPADNADDAERNAASCIISQRKTDRVGGEFHSVIVVICGFGFCLRLSAGSARDIMGVLSADCLTTLM